jgi:hypothetical protein
MAWQKSLRDSHHACVFPCASTMLRPDSGNSVSHEGPWPDGDPNTSRRFEPPSEVEAVCGRSIPALSQCPKIRLVPLILESCSEAPSLKPWPRSLQWRQRPMMVTAEGRASKYLDADAVGNLRIVLLVGAVSVAV